MAFSGLGSNRHHLSLSSTRDLSVNGDLESLPNASSKEDRLKSFKLLVTKSRTKECKESAN